MNCPVCDAQLRTVTKHNVEVEICPDCKGVWLDRGELDKILEMASAGGPSGYRDEPAPRAESREYRREEREEYRPERRDERDHRERDERYDGGGHDPRHGKHKRRGSWLGEILEGFGGGED